MTCDVLSRRIVLENLFARAVRDGVFCARKYHNDRCVTTAVKRCISSILADCGGALAMRLRVVT